jgi:hypothetical protein
LSPGRQTTLVFCGLKHIARIEHPEQPRRRSVDFRDSSCSAGLPTTTDLSDALLIAISLSGYHFFVFYARKLAQPA